MITELFQPLVRTSSAAALILAAGFATAEPQHGIAMYGDPALPADFEALPYANPDAPTGGKIVTANVGSFDSLNPYILKGSVHWQMRYLIGESLMGRSLDEPFSLYGVLAETIETGPDREWVEFVLRPEAKFSDGTPVTVEDVIWSFETLGTVGHPRYHGFFEKIATLEQTGERSVKFTFNTEDQELALLAGLRPILQKAQWDGVDFAESGVDILPITSGPYVIDDFDAGRFISLKRNPDYWGRDVVPFMNGVHNIDEVRLEFFGDETAAFEAFKVGEVNTNREFNVARWEGQYNFPAVTDGDIVKSVLPHKRPSGMTGFVMNTRRDQFKDWRVRDALIHAFNFEFINESMTGSAQPRITSFWSNSPLSMEAGLATGRVAEFLAPFADDLVPGTIEGYTLPVSDGSVRNRANIGKALEQFEAAGWSVQEGALKDADGNDFTFEILLQVGASEPQAIIDMYVETLSRVGITPTVSTADSAQYKERTDAFDFDMTYYRSGVSLSPGNEQYSYFGIDDADTIGGRNMMGVKSEAVDAMIDRLLTSDDQDDFVAAVKALDRTLTAGRYVIPIYQWNISRIAHSKNLHYPENLPIFGDWPGWQPDVWWYEE
ncbi:peptide/nickel transport system substrate-binding protein [Loktanella ponticola]|uniref:Peptide/nickel transport system substrate-binding protein n=1 Tax=Yoonia ponticola TaxID=1524255 RepID=A0A7W9BNZ8_9RHOB|nr:extracellular solute-binding protein [Yoonia ponticola]MBB5724032.1 peptide/nickel transport system substrate-binding protein [Yoonia ponticola]